MKPLLFCLIFTCYTFYAQQFDWVKISSPSSGAQLCTDDENNVYLASCYQWTGSPTTTRLKKYDQQGNLIWEKVLQGYLWKIADKAYSRILLLVADSVGTALYKFDKQGNLLEKVYGLSLQYPYWYSDLKVDKNENYYLCGAFEGTVSICNYTLYGQLESHCGLIAKFSGDDYCLWVKQTQGAENQLSGCSVDANGNVFTTGFNYLGALSFDTYTLPASPPAWSNGFVAKLSAGGEIQWLRAVSGSSAWPNPKKLSNDNDGNVFVYGELGGGALVLGNDTLINNPYQNSDGLFICKMSPDGNFIWARGIKNISSRSEALNIATTGDGQSYLAGRYYDSLMFGNITLKTRAAPIFSATLPWEDAFVASYDSQGNLGWVLGTQCDSLSRLTGQDCALTSDEIYFTGYFGGNCFFTPNNINGGSSSTFISKISDPLLALKNQEPEDHSLLVFPNPSNGKFELVFKERKKREFEVTDVLGTRVHEEQGNDEKISVDLSGNKAGIYFVRIRSQSGLNVVKIVKQ